MNITYNALCATCKGEGKDSRLHRNLNEPETVFCKEGHKFSGPEIEDYLTSQPDIPIIPKSKPAEESFEAPPLPPQVKEIQENMQKAFDESFSMAPPPQVDPPAGSRTAASVLAQREEAAAGFCEHLSARGEKIAAVPGFEPQKAVGTLVEEPASEPQPGPKLVQKQARRLPGGSLVIEVTIPDQHASFLAGEAETRGKTVEEHFREMVEYGLESRWFY